MKNSESGRKKKPVYYFAAVFLLSFFTSCTTVPSVFGLAIFPSSVDFNELRPGISQDELKSAGVIPNQKRSVFLGSYDFHAKEWIGRDLETWIFKNSRYTRQFLYFEEALLIGWEELPVRQEGLEEDYRGGWKEWPRDSE